jgi:hypothetical protein
MQVALLNKTVGNNLIHKLDEFIRKYYKNQLIKGLIYSFTAVLLFFLSIILLEYFGNFSSGTRQLLFYAFIAISMAIMVNYIAVPLFKLNKLGKTINHETAANIIGQHFANVKDKLLNTLQLISISDNSAYKNDLLVASINQKITELNPVPFSSAIDIKNNRKYLKYAIIPVLIFLFLFLINANIISDGTHRLINYSTEYIPQAPFLFNLENDDLTVIENNDYDLNITITGNSIPNEVFIVRNGKEFKLKKETKNSYSYTFSHVQKEQDFYLKAAGFNSQNYELKTIPNALIMGFRVKLDYPNYTGLQDQTLENTGDLNVPQGTKIKWEFSTKNTNEVSFKFKDSLVKLNKDAQNLYSLTKQINKNESYTIKTANDYLINKDSVSYYINVKADEFPLIEVSEKTDSVNTKIKYFNGIIGDDYGFSNLVFNYRTLKIDSTGKPLAENEFISVPIQFNGSFNKDQFFHYWDFGSAGLELGESIEYFFQVWDNDKVNGHKSARSSKQIIKAPTKDELKEQLEEKNDNIKDELKESLKDAEKLKDDIKKLKESVLNKKNLDWQDKKKVQDILKQQQDLNKQLNDIKNENSQKNQEKEEYQDPSEDIKKQQENLEKLMDELNSEEMKKLYEKLEKLSEKMDKKDLQETLEEMDLENMDLKKELERSLEMFKQMEMDEKLEELANELNELAEKQEELAKDEQKTEEEKTKEQEELNKEFEDIQKEMDELKKKNEELENKKDTEKLSKKEEEIKKDMMESLEKLQKSKEQKAKESQEDAAEKMKEMAAEMESMMSSNDTEKMQENMDDMRALLENLITLSFDQEDLMENLKKTNTNDPQYVKLGQQQIKLKDDAKMIEDSLFALSKRVEQIQSIVNREMNKINSNIKSSLYNIQERATTNAIVNQQFTMTSINNLALLLDEALKQMQQQMANKTPGSGSCNNPGGSKPKPGVLPGLKKAKDGVGESLKKLQEQMGKKEGKTPSKDGKDGKSGEGGESAKELARMAAEQAALREGLKQLSQELNKDGSGAGNGLKKIEKDMEQVEEDIINNNITPETVKRQQDILTRLLESEKALREREFDEERKSKNVKNQKISNPEEFLEYKRKKEKEIELLKTIPPALIPYYKNRVNEYFNSTN